MKTLLKYLPYLIVAVAAFFVARLTTPDRDKEIIKRFEEDRKAFRDSIKLRDAKIIDLAKAGSTIKEKMYTDSLKNVEALRAKNEAYSKLKVQYEKINFRRASSFELDSAINRLYPE